MKFSGCCAPGRGIAAIAVGRCRHRYLLNGVILGVAASSLPGLSSRSGNPGEPLPQFRGAGDGQLIQGVGDGLQVPARQVKVDDRVLDIGMSQQNLDGTQVDARFQQVRGKAVPQGVHLLLMI